MASAGPGSWYITLNGNDGIDMVGSIEFILKVTCPTLSYLIHRLWSREKNFEVAKKLVEDCRDHGKLIEIITPWEEKHVTEICKMAEKVGFTHLSPKYSFNPFRGW
jgi:hypothetical protein